MTTAKDSESSSNGVVIHVLGDLHGFWTQTDVEFLSRGNQDLVMFVGDLGDEDVEIVRRIDELPVEKVVILGNHDAWRSFSNKQPSSRLVEMLGVLGDDHLGYSVRNLDVARMSIVGARPFSWGGVDIRSPEVYGELFGVQSSEDSADRIAQLAAEAKYDDLLILAHNGPYGISNSADAIYGKDFGRRPGGDWGDRDLRDAIRQIELSGKRVRLVVAGHMHDRLHRQIGGFRDRFARRDETLFVNPAVVPRIRSHADGGETRHYLRIELADGGMRSLNENWVDAAGSIRERFTPRFTELAARA